LIWNLAVGAFLVFDPWGFSCLESSIYSRIAEYLNIEYLQISKVECKPLRRPVCQQVARLSNGVMQKKDKKE
jgi:hypothetical protein